MIPVDVLFMPLPFIFPAEFFSTEFTFENIWLFLMLYHMSFKSVSMHVDLVTGGACMFAKIFNQTLQIFFFSIHKTNNMRIFMYLSHMSFECPPV